MKPRAVTASSKIGGSDPKQGQGQVNVAAIIQKFRKDDIPQHKKDQYKVMHMQRNTLLEPNNVVAAWGENSNEEKAEVSDTLKNLRLKYDTIHQTVLAKQQELEDLKRQLVKAGEEETYMNNLHDYTEEVMTTTEDNLDSLKEEHDFEKLQGAQYKYVKSRLQKDLIASQLKSQEL